MPRYASRRDTNHQQIKGIFEDLGCSVIDLAGAPVGFDLAVGYKTQCILIEVKDGSRPESARKLTENEGRIHLNWHGPKAIVKNVDEAQLVVALLRKRHFSVMDTATAEWLGS